MTCDSFNYLMMISPCHAACIESFHFMSYLQSFDISFFFVLLLPFRLASALPSLSHHQYCTGWRQYYSTVRSTFSTVDMFVQRLFLCSLCCWLVEISLLVVFVGGRV